jgi:hypothetical protein
MGLVLDDKVGSVVKSQVAVPANAEPWLSTSAAAPIVAKVALAPSLVPTDLTDWVGILVVFISVLVFGSATD